MDGYVKLFRQLLGSSVFDNADLLKVWVWCLLKATHAEHKQMVGLQEETLLPGQFIFGRKKAAQELMYSENKTYRLINKLKNMQNIDIKSNNKYSIITIVNWELYQGLNGVCEQQSEQQIDNKQTTNRQQIDTNKKDKKEKKEKNNTNGELADTEKNNYKSVYDHYLSLNLIKHIKYTDTMVKAIKKAMDENKYSIEDCKVLLDRHKKVTELTKNDGRYAVRVRPLHEFFGQKVKDATHLICAEYDIGGKYYEKYIKPEEIKQDRVPFKPKIVYVNEG